MCASRYLPGSNQSALRFALQSRQVRSNFGVRIAHMEQVANRPMLNEVLVEASKMTMEGDAPAFSNASPRDGTIQTSYRSVSNHHSRNWFDIAISAGA